MKRFAALFVEVDATTDVGLELAVGRSHLDAALGVDLDRFVGDASQGRYRCPLEESANTSALNSFR